MNRDRRGRAGRMLRKLRPGAVRRKAGIEAVALARSVVGERPLEATVVEARASGPLLLLTLSREASLRATSQALADRLAAQVDPAIRGADFILVPEVARDTLDWVLPRPAEGDPGSSRRRHR